MRGPDTDARDERWQLSGRPSRRPFATNPSGAVMISRLAARVRSLLRNLRQRSGLDSDMTEEFRHHVELRAQDLVRAGLPSAEAMRRARREFGNPERYKDEGRE